MFRKVPLRWIKTYYGDIQYTEDGIKVFNLYLANLPHPITESDVYNYFLRYGMVESVKIHEKGLARVLNRYGFVNFREAESAGRTMSNRPHYIRGHNIRVRHADSWRQPGSEQEKDGDSISIESKDYDPNKSPIFLLNEDCLLYLCSFLSLGALRNLSKTCIHFSRILETILHQKKALTSNNDDPLTLMQLREILLKAGSDLHQIRDHDENRLRFPHRTLKLIAQMCPNLRELEMIRCVQSMRQRIKGFAFKNIGLKLHYLTKLELIQCNLNDAMCLNLVPLQNVDYIDFSYNTAITGRYLDQFPKLVYLQLNSCRSLQKCCLKSICDRGILKWLEIIYCINLDSDYLEEVLLNLKHLEKLVFSAEPSPNGKNKITELENLKSLTGTTHAMNVDFFKKLTKNKSEKLERLVLLGNLCNERLNNICKFKNLRELCLFRTNTVSDSCVEQLSNFKQLKFLCLAYCGHVTSEGLIKLFEQPTEIKELDITGCWRIGQNVIFEIAERIKKRGTKSRCTIYQRYFGGKSKDILMRIQNVDPFVLLCFKECPLHNSKAEILLSR